MKLEHGDMVMDLTVHPISLRDELTRFWITKDDSIVDVSFRRYLRIIKRAFGYLAYRHDRKRIEIERVCARIGAPFLHNIPGVPQIKQARHYVIENSGNGSEEIRIFENRFFDLGTEDTIRYHGRLLENDASQITAFSDSMGLSHSICYQVAFIYPLLHTDIPTPIYNDLATLFQRFCQTVKVWGYQAQKIQQECKVVDKSYRIPLEEVLP